MRTYKGFTLVEMLISMVILGILMLAFTQIFGGSLRASSEINSRNELVNEGQIAQQLITSKLQGAYYLYTGTLQLTSGGDTTKNTVRSGAGQSWAVGTDPFVAILVPPTMSPSPAAGAPSQCPVDSASSSVKASNNQFCFTFYAYYPMRRGSFVTNVPNSSPPADPNNENGWVLMEYRANVFDGVDRSGDQLRNPPLPGTASGTGYTGRSGQMLVDYVQPATSTPTYTMFRVCDPRLSIAQPNCPVGTTATSPRLVDFDLRLLQNRVGKKLSAPAGSEALRTRVYPRNWN